MKTRNTSSLYDIIKKQFFKISKTAKIDRHYLLVVDKWRQIAGDKLYKFSFPTKITKSCLYVAVESPSLMSQTSYFKNGMLSNIRAFLPDEKIKDIKFFIEANANKHVDFDFTQAKQAISEKQEEQLEQDPLKKSLLKLAKHIK